MSTQNSQRVLDAKAFLAILNSRKTLNTTHDGEQVLLTIQGQGTFFPKGETYEVAGEQRTNEFDRTIYNVKVNSQLSMLRPEIKAILDEALKAESAGETDKAHELFNEYLNGVQVSFSVIEPSSRKFASGDMVTAVVAIAETKSGSRQIVINDVRYKAPKVIDTVKYDMTELLGN